MSEYFRKPIVKTLMLKGQAGQSIKGIEKTGTSGLVDTYTITLTDGTTSTFSVENGKGISSISKTETSGLVDTYTIEFNDGTTSTFTVTNGDSDYKPAVDALEKKVDNLILSSRNEVTPEMFGAVGDGIADDTEAIQKAIDSGAGIVFFNKRKYLIKGTLSISSNITFSGKGIDSIIFTNIDNVLIDVSGNITFVIENVQIKNESTGRTNNSVYIHGISNTIIKNVFFNGNNYGGKFDLYIEKVTTSIVEKCIFNHSSLKLNTWDCKVDKCWVWALSQNYGIYIVDSSGNITITNTDVVPPFQSNSDYVQHENIESNWDSAKLQAGIVIGNTVSNVKMSNIYIDGNPTLVTGRGIIVNKGCFNILIDDWSANKTNDDLILVNSSFGVTISRGQIHDYNGEKRDLIRFMNLDNLECHNNEISSNTFISTTKDSNFIKLNSVIRVDSSFSGKILHNKSFYNNGVGSYKNPIVVENYSPYYELYTNIMMGADYYIRKTGTLQSGTKSETINFSYYGFRYKPYAENVKLIKSTGEIIPFKQISDKNNIYISLTESLTKDTDYIISVKL